MSQTNQGNVRVRNNVPRVIGLAAQTVILHPNQSMSVPQETWKTVLEHPLTPQLLRNGVIALVKDGDTTAADRGGQKQESRR